MRNPVCIFALLAVGSVASAQSDAGKPKPADPAQLDHDRETQAVREGKLIHQLIRHSLGLSIDADTHLKLTPSEAGTSLAAARSKLRELQSVLATRAAELNARRQGAAEGNPPTRVVGSTGAAAAPAVEMAPRSPRTGNRSPRRSEPGVKNSPRNPSTTSRPGKARRKKDAPQKPIAKVAAIITGSGSRSAVGRILFKAGRYATAVKELAAFEGDKNADFGDLFYLARCHERIHDAAKAAAVRAAEAAVKAKKAAADAETASGKIRDAGRHLRSAGGTVESVTEYQRLMGVRTEELATASKQDAESKSKRREAALHYEKAYGVFILIEGRDLSPAEQGPDLPGRWATAARSARNMMRWLETNQEWEPPAIRRAK